MYLKLFLLYNQYQNNEIQSLQRINHQYKQSAWNSADPWTEKRDNIGHADNHAYEDCIGSTYNIGTNKANNADYDGIHNLAPDKANKCTMNKPEGGNNFVSCFAVEQCVYNLFRLSSKLLFTAEYIDGNNKANDKIPECLENADYT